MGRRNLKNEPAALHLNVDLFENELSDKASPELPLPAPEHKLITEAFVACKGNKGALAGMTVALIKLALRRWQMKCTVLRKVPVKPPIPLQPQASKPSAGTGPGTFSVLRVKGKRLRLVGAECSHHDYWEGSYCSLVCRT